MPARIKTYTFSEFLLNPAKRTLFRGRKEIKLRDKDYDVLLFLIENAPEICLHDEIIEAVWNGTSVENNSLEKSIATIRAILGDKAKNPQFIKTIRAKGYLFVGDLKEFETLLPKQEIEKPQTAIIKTNKSSRIKIASFVMGFIFFLGIALLFWLKSGEVWRRYNSKVIFADDFSSGEIDSNRWKVKGKTVKVENGIAKLIVEETDNQGKLESSLFSFDRSKSVTIKSRLKISYSENLKDKVYFIGMFGITPKTPLFSQVDIHNNYIFGIKYTNHDYESRYPNGDLDLMKSEGFFLFKYCGAPFKKDDYRDGKISKRIKPKWHEWFEQTIIYNPSNGEMSYIIDGNLEEVFNVGNLLKEMDEDKLRIEIDPAGWWLHHSIEIDYVEITQ